MNQPATDPFVVIKATDNTELANRNEKVLYATSVITVNERAYPFAHVFENKQDAQKCTQQIIHELRELATNDAVTHESYNAELSSEALDTDRSVINSDIEAPAALVIPAADDSCTEVSTMSASINTERSTALVARSSSESVVIDSQKTADDELMRSFIQFISGNREMDNGVSFAKKAAEERISSYTLMEKIVNTIPMKMVGEVLYYYDKALYHYIQLTDSDSKRLIMLLCRDDVKEYGSPAIVRAVHEFITMNPDIVSSIHDTIHPDYLGFRNGILDLRTFRFLAPTPDIFITNIVDDYYEPGFTGQSLISTHSFTAAMMGTQH